MNLADAIGKPARWRFRLMLYNFDKVQQADVKQQAADALSPLNTRGIDASHINIDTLLLAIATLAQKTQRSHHPHSGKYSYRDK